VLEPVPGRWRLRVLLLRFEPEERLWEKSGRVGSLVRLSRRSSSLSLEGSTSQTEDLVVSFARAAGGGGVGSAMSRSESVSGAGSAARLVDSSADQMEETVDRCGFQRPDAKWGLQRPDAGPGVKSRSDETDVPARELEDDGARIRGY
jgi:hypothetical protein